MVPANAIGAEGSGRKGEACLTLVCVCVWVGGLFTERLLGLADYLNPKRVQQLLHFGGNLRIHMLRLLGTSCGKITTSVRRVQSLHCAGAGSPTMHQEPSGSQSDRISVLT